MNNIYLGSDWHFSKYKKKEEMLKYDNRKNRDILRKYRSTVTDNDIFLFLGDLTEVRDDNPRLVKRSIEQIKELPGKKIFIRGNNDIEPDEYYINHLGFLTCLNGLSIDNFIFTHDPIKIKEGVINIHGHLHGATTYWNCDEKNHVDCYTRMYNNYPIKIGPLLYKGQFIDKRLLDDGQTIDNLKLKLFEYVRELELNKKE